MKKSKSANRKSGVFLMLIGVALMLSAIAVYGFFSYQDLTAQTNSSGILKQVKAEIPDTHAYTESSDNEFEEMKLQLIDGYEYAGFLSIPALDIELPVMAQWDYTRLELAPCIYHGSLYTNDIVIAAHNYTSHFGKLSTLDRGDVVNFTDMNGAVHKYQVYDIEILQPTDIKEMIESEWDLTLYTCTYGAQNRVTVRCLRAE